MSILPNLSTRYLHLVEQGHIQSDVSQQNLLSLLQIVMDCLLLTKKRSFFRKKKPISKSCNLYIYGNVGRGKSMLMDIFFEAVPESKNLKKRRVHFHSFMQEVHARIHKLRQKSNEDLVKALAREIATETQLLCFDELQATDVTDATLLYRLFTELFANNVCIVSTSNRPPADLYTGGVQAERFKDFVNLIEEKMTVAPLSNHNDYRYLKNSKQLQFYYYPLGAEADKFIDKTAKQLCMDTLITKETLVVQGRRVAFEACNNKIGFFTFNKLCETMLGAADYLALARRLNTIILTKIPKLTPEKRNEAKRFATLVDTLYEHKIKLICTAAVPVEQLYQEGDGAFEFQRTISRLVEMQSTEYNERLKNI
ncbi:MAG: cell division protein ZapE [Rickettsiales bacterium]|jgi:cell division protein ZapE